MAQTRHHILFEKALWMARPESRRVRTNGGLIVKLGQAEHTALHQTVSNVPPPNIYMARYMANEFYSDGDIFENIDRLCHVIDGSIQHPKTSLIDKQIGALMIEAVELQVPFIREGVCRGER